MWRNSDLSIGFKVGALEGMVTSLVLCGSGTWVVNARERRKVEEVLDKNCLVTNL